MRVAIVGAGISGSTLGYALHRLGFDVDIFERARGIGGRMAVYRHGPYAFDIGAQCLVARTAAFQEFLAPLIEAGTVQPWQGRVITIQPDLTHQDRPYVETHWVGVPSMNTIVHLLTQGLQLHLNTSIVNCQKDESGCWTLSDHTGKRWKHYDWLLLTGPPQQINTLFPLEHAPWNTVKMHTAHAMLLGFDTIAVDWIAAKVTQSPIKWISINSSKPGRSVHKSTVVLHTHQNWSKSRVELDFAEVEAILGQEYQRLVGVDWKSASCIHVHRWREAIVSTPGKNGHYCDLVQQIGCVGDWSQTSRIEEVWLSAMALVKAMQA